MFIPQAQPHAQSLFLFPIVLVLIWFIFSIFSTRKKNGAAGNSIVCFAASIPCQSRHLTVRRIRTVSKSATFLAMESVNAAHFKRWETEVQNFGKEKRKTLRQYWGAHFWQGEVQNSSPILARQWWRHFRLSLSLSLSLCISLSLSPNVPHAQYRKRFRASYNENDSSYNLNTPACNASGSQMFHPKLCEASVFGVKRLATRSVTGWCVEIIWRMMTRPGSLKNYMKMMCVKVNPLRAIHTWIRRTRRIRLHKKGWFSICQVWQ